MHSDISKSDWRHFREIHNRVLERFCQRVLDELTACARSTEGTAHDRYIHTYELMRKRNKELSNAFDGLKPSEASLQLALMQKMDLLTAEDLDGFSPEVKEILQRYRSLGAADLDSGSEKK